MVFLSAFLSNLIKSPDLFWRIPLLNFGILLAPAYFLVVILFSDTERVIDVCSCIMVELLLCGLYFLIVKRILVDVAKVRTLTKYRYLKISFFLLLLLNIPAIFGEGFGIFSEGLRTDFIYNSAWMKYLVYFTIPLSTLEIVMVSRLIGLKEYRTFCVFVILMHIILGILSGSKGGAILYLASIFSFTSNKNFKLNYFIFLLVFLFILMVVTVYMMSLSLNIKEIDAFNLMISRVLLNNDARALSLDFKNFDAGYAHFLQESFRSLSKLFGYSPSNAPIGVVLYDRLLDANMPNQGANASITALALYYLSDDSVLIVLFPMCLLFLLIVYMISKFKAISKLPEHKLLVSLYLLALCNLFSQDFLAFQLMFFLLPFYLSIFLIICRLRFINFFFLGGLGVNTK